MLQKLFAKFDRDSTKYKLYKLCTIGDAYVAVSEPVTEDNEVGGVQDPTLPETDANGLYRSGLRLVAV